MPVMLGVRRRVQEPAHPWMNDAPLLLVRFAGHLPPRSGRYALSFQAFFRTDALAVIECLLKRVDKTRNLVGGFQVFTFLVRQRAPRETRDR